MKTLIILLGKELIPNYRIFKEIKPDRTLIISTPEMSNQKEIIKNLFEKNQSSYRAITLNDAFDFNEISAKITEEDLIYYYKSISKSYNLTNGGDGMKGIQRFKEDNPFYGAHHSEKSKQQISNAQKGSNNTMFGTKATCAIKVNGKYLTEYAEELTAD